MIVVESRKKRKLVDYKLAVSLARLPVSKTLCTIYVVYFGGSFSMDLRCNIIIILRYQKVELCSKVNLSQSILKKTQKLLRVKCPSF